MKNFSIVCFHSQLDEILSKMAASETVFDRRTLVHEDNGENYVTFITYFMRPIWLFRSTGCGRIGASGFRNGAVFGICILTAPTDEIDGCFHH